MAIGTTKLTTDESLENDIAHFVLSHPNLRTRLDNCAEKIRSKCSDAPNEATIAAYFESIVGGELSRIGIQYFPERESAIQGTQGRLRGRIDSRVGDVIIEYKQPSTLSTVQDRENATNQVLDYAEALHAETGRTTLAFVTDGQRVQRVQVRDDGSVNLGAFDVLDGGFLHELTHAVVSTNLLALSSKNLVNSFCGPDSKVQDLSRALYENLDDSAATDKTKMLFAEWQVLFKLAHDDTSKQQSIDDRRKALNDALGVTIASGDSVGQYRALFALQTAYSIVLKCLAANVVHGLRRSSHHSLFRDLATQDFSAVQRFLQTVENGDVFRASGIENLLEGDFFSWYSYPSQFRQDIFKAILPIFSEISQYESLSFFHGDMHAAEDLFKDLYMRMIPEKVRHSLGEFYTPHWLADHTIRTALARLEESRRSDWTALDPTCGSGTFLTAAMQIVLDETDGLDPAYRVSAILERVVGADLNPLAVLTARINYFINISSLLDDITPIEIPVYLGDASKAKTKHFLDEISCVSHVIDTEKGPLSISLPEIALENRSAFASAMRTVESLARDGEVEEIVSTLLRLVPSKLRTAGVTASISEFACRIVELEKLGWNGIWARIISDFFVTSTLGEFDIVVGNPPWIDWKNLPQSYRASLVAMCVERHLFSGDGVTGGINLNICALISVTAASNWLAPHGVMALLMPDTLLYQRSYEGYRNLMLDEKRRIYLDYLVDWTKSGHPFAPVQQKFFTYVFTHSKPTDFPGVQVARVLKKSGRNRPNSISMLQFGTYSEVEEHFDVEYRWAEPVHPGYTYYTVAEDGKTARRMGKLAGVSPYRGREGVEFYPQELFLLSFQSLVSPGVARFENYQGRTSKHKVPKFSLPLETEFMRPLIKGTMVSRFHVQDSQYFVPFYYEQDQGDGRIPVSRSVMRKRSPLLYQLLQNNREILDIQTDHNAKIMGKSNTEFYAVARVGSYSHAENYVVYRDNTSWGASVVSRVSVPWGGERVPVFQNHAVSICERPDGSFIGADEAHYICAVLNSPLVTRFILSSADSRSFRVRVPVGIPLFDENSKIHRKLAELSRAAHDGWDIPGVIERVDDELEHAVAQLFSLDSL